MFDNVNDGIGFLTRGTTSLKDYPNMELSNDTAASYEGSLTLIPNVSASRANAFTYRNTDTNVSTPFFTLAAGECIWLRSTASAPFTYKIVNCGTIATPATGGGSGTTYTLPVAPDTVLGGVKQGANVAIAADGTLSVGTSIIYQVSQTIPSYVAGSKFDFNGELDTSAVARLPAGSDSANSYAYFYGTSVYDTNGTQFT